MTTPIALHVAAKRYLCAVEPDYHAGLSAVATQPLPPGWADGRRRAGGVPGDARLGRAVALRRWDDAGKVDGAAVLGLASYERLLRSLACCGS